TVIIDPWIQTPAFASNLDCVWECEKDGAGNVYLIGGTNPMQLKKYNSTGVLQWTYNTPYDTTAWLGTFAVDNVGNSYVTQGSAAQIVKVSPAGAVLWNNTNPFPTMILTEFWSLAFNCDQTKLIIGGTGGSYIPPYPYIYEINMANGNVVSSVKVAGAKSLGSEVRAIAPSGNGRYYFLTHDSIGYINQAFSSCPYSSSAGPRTNNSYTLSYKCENFRYDNAGIAAIKANTSFVYTHWGDRLDKRSLATGAIVASVAIPSGGFNGGAVQNSGIDIDNCGNVYVGSTNAVVKYDGNTLTQLAIYPTTYIVYDIVINSNGDIVACGSTGNSSIPIRSGYIESISTGTCMPMTQVCCDASICSQNNFCINDLPTTLQTTSAGGAWSGTGISNLGVFDPAMAGIGTHIIKYTLPCGSDSITATVHSCYTISVCITSGSLTALGGNGNYLWTSSTTSINCASCPNGICSGFVCNGVVVPTWTASGTTVLAPASNVFPIMVKDVISNITFTFSTLASIPLCTTTSIHEIDKENNTILIYPNPNNGEFSINYSFIQQGQELVLIDMLGREVKQIKLENNKGIKNINVSDLSNGIYSYKVQSKKETLFVGRINVIK
ncbi:MAG: T9SS type A sorting domain-containing protein, partial [Bacteroidia bacterium]|nr:T9SS type A sorting domain-containing protein [Bacteroidia bacterium]